MAPATSMSDRNWEGLDYYASKYLPGFNSAKQFAEGLKEKNFLKSAIGLGTTAYSIGTLFAPQFRLSNLASKGISKVAGTVVNKYLGNYPVWQAAINGNRNKLLSSLYRDTMKFGTTAYESQRFHKVPSAMQPFHDWMLKDVNYNYKASNQRPFNLGDYIPSFNTKVPWNDPSVIQKARNIAAKPVHPNIFVTGTGLTPPSYSSNYSPGVSHNINRFPHSPSYQKYKKQIAKEWYNKPHIPPLKPIPFDVNSDPGILKPRLDNPNYDQFGNSLAKGKNPIN